MKDVDARSLISPYLLSVASPGMEVMSDPSSKRDTRRLSEQAQKKFRHVFLPVDVI